MPLNDTNDFTIDPFTQVYDRIWDILESKAEFTDLIKKGNRIKFSTIKVSPLKKQTLDADFPEVSLIPQGGESPLTISSSTAKFDRTFFLAIISGTLRANKHLFPIEWICLKILSGAADNFGLSFVKKFEVGSSDWKIIDNEFTRGKEGWFSIIPLSVSIVVPKTDLII